MEIRELENGALQLLRGAPEGALGVLDIEVTDGVVILNGRVPGLTSKRVAGAIAWWTPGIYIAGGIAPRIAEYLAISPFRRHFEAKGRFEAYVSGIPTWVIIHSQPTAVGLQCMASDPSVGRR